MDAESDKGFNLLVREHSSLIFESSGIGIAAPSTLAERRIVKPAEWHHMLDDRIVRYFQNERAAMITGESTCRGTKDAYTKTAAEFRISEWSVKAKIRKGRYGRGRLSALSS